MLKQVTNSGNLLDEKSVVAMTGRKLGSRALVFDKVEVVESPRAAVVHEGGQSNFARQVAEVLGLHTVYTTR